MFGLPASLFAFIIILGLLIVLAMTRRTWLVTAILAYYPAAIVYANLPLFAPKTELAAIGTFIVLLGLSWWAISGNVMGDWGGGFPRAVALAIGGFALVIALWVYAVPSFAALMPIAPILADAAHFLGYGGLLLVPVALFLLRLA